MGFFEKERKTHGPSRAEPPKLGVINTESGDVKSFEKMFPTDLPPLARQKAIDSSEAQRCSTYSTHTFLEYSFVNLSGPWVLKLHAQNFTQT